MRVPVWFGIVLLLFAAPVLAQQGDFLRALNEYGPTYYPISTADLRLPAPATWTMPAFGNYSLSEILAAKVTNGEFYNIMRTFPVAAQKNITGVRDDIKVRARELCDVPGAPASQLELDCLNFFASAGVRAAELAIVSNYDICRGNVQAELNAVNDGRVNGSITDMAAMANYAVWATALKTCQVNGRENVTVVAPTPSNTIPSGPPPLKKSPPTITEQDVSDITAPQQPAIAPPAKDYTWWYMGGAVVLAVLLVFYILGRPKVIPV